MQAILLISKSNTMSTTKILIGFMVGAAVGGALGILLAPDTGEETRRKIREKGADLGDSLSEWGDSVKGKFNDMVTDAKEHFNKNKSQMS
jgi:gas vesicle protein